MADIQVFSRAQLLERLSNNFKARVIDAGLSASPDIGPDSYEYKLFASIVDTFAIQSQNARIMARGIALQDMNFDQLKAFGNLPGINLPPLTAVGAFGYIQITTATGGTTLVNGDEWVNNATKLIYRVVSGGTYADQAWVPVQCKTGGVATNVADGVVLTASVTRAGCYPTAPVVLQRISQLGLSGGREAETQGDYLLRLSNAIAHPASMGNLDEIIAAAENSTGHGVPVAKAFAYPAIVGPGTYAIALLLTPATLTGTRNPSSGQLSAVAAFIEAQLGIDDGLFMLETHNQGCLPVFTVRWSRSSAGWADVTPWPRWNSQIAYISTATSATSFIISATNYSGFGAPTNGCKLAIWNQDTGLFVRKTVASFSGTGPWTIVVDQTANASDLSYSPAANQMVMPWSDNLNDVAPIIVNYFLSLGGGENSSDTFSPTSTDRCWRHPAPDSTSWPNTLTNKVSNLVAGVASVADVTYVTDVAVGLGHAETTTTVGTSTVFVYCIQLQDLCILPA